jgi:hypothetical protein
MRRSRLATLAVVVAAAGCTTVAPSFYDSAPLHDANLARCAWSGKFKSPVVHQESDHVRGYFEAADLDAYRRAVPSSFTLPERPLIRVTVLDFYEM